MIEKEVIVIGAGLAGTEAAWQVANNGVPVTLVEMRPFKSTPAHHTDEFGELVCSNSFGAISADRAAGLLQKELRIFKMLRTIVVFAPIIAALAWVVFNIQKPAREQFNRDFLGKD